MNNNDLTPGDRIKIRNHGWATYLGPFNRKSEGYGSGHIWSSYDGEDGHIMHGPGGDRIQEIIPVTSNEQIVAALKTFHESGKDKW